MEKSITIFLALVGVTLLIIGWFGTPQDFQWLSHLIIGSSAIIVAMNKMKYA